MSFLFGLPLPPCLMLFQTVWAAQLQTMWHEAMRMHHQVMRNRQLAALSTHESYRRYLACGGYRP